MIKIHEVTHHGSTYNERDYELPDDFTEADVQQMLATCIYPMRDTVAHHLTRVTQELRLGQTANHGWTRWNIVHEPVTPDYKKRAVAAVFVGDYLPAHDEVFDLAEEVAGTLTRLHAYISGVRDPEQATQAVSELLTKLTEETP